MMDPLEALKTVCHNYERVKDKDDYLYTFCDPKFPEFMDKQVRATQKDRRANKKGAFVYEWVE